MIAYPIQNILMIVTNLVYYIMIAHIIMSWLINFQVLNLRQPFVYQLWDGINRLVEPIYRPIRRFMPDTGALDLAPLVALVGLTILRILIGGYIRF